MKIVFGLLFLFVWKTRILNKSHQWSGLNTCAATESSEENSRRHLQGAELILHLQESTKQIQEYKSRNLSVPICSGMLKQAYETLNEQYLQEILNANVKYRMTMASDKRQRTTAYISREALLSPYGGDFVETGVYTGGTSAVMMRILMDFDTCNRKFYAFDSFAGLPASNPEDRFGAGMIGHKGQFVVTQERYENNLKRVNAWNESIIRISKGWFNETCAKSPVKRISFLRLDGDIFISTWDALTALYSRVVPGGFIYVDDYGSFNGCREAVDKFRTQRKVYEPLRYIREDTDSVVGRADTFGKMIFEAVWWQKRLVKSAKKTSPLRE